MKKILFFTQYYFSSKNYEGNDARYMTDIIDVAANVRPEPIKVFCATENPSGREHLVRDGVNIYRLTSTRGDKNKLYSRIIKFLSISIRFLWQACKNCRKDDIVFVVTNPAFFLVVAGILKRTFRYKLILLTYDIFPENVVAAKLISKNNLLYLIACKIFNFAYRSADRLIAIGVDMKQVLIAKGVDPRKIVVIRNWEDEKSIHPGSVEENDLIRKYNLTGKRIFLYAGNLGRVQGIPNLLEAIQKANLNNAAFLFVGDGQMSGELTDFISKNPHLNIVRTGFLPREQASTFLSAGHIAIVSLNDDMTGLGVPSKSYSYLAAGLPLLFIGAPESEIAHMIREKQIGWEVKNSDADLLAKSLFEISKIPDAELQNIQKRARQAAETTYSRTSALKQYENIFKSF